MGDVWNDDGDSANWNPYGEPAGGQVRTSWDLEGQPHPVTENYGEYDAQPTNTGADWWVSNAYTTAPVTTATATESWMSQVTSDASLSQSQWHSETQTQTQSQEYTTTDTATDPATTTLSTTTSQASTSTAETTTTTSTSSTTSPTTTTATSASASTTSTPSPSGLPPHTKIAIAVPVAILGTALLFALLFFILRRRRRRIQRNESRSGPYMDMRDPSTSNRQIPSHAHAHSLENPWDSMSRNLVLLGGPPGMGMGTGMGGSSSIRSNSRHASERDLSGYENQQQQTRGSHPSLHRPSLSIAGSGFGLLPDPLHSHPNTPTTDESPSSLVQPQPQPQPPQMSSTTTIAGSAADEGKGIIGLARTTSAVHEHHKPSTETNKRPQSPFDHPLDDAVSEISRVSGGRRSTLFGGHGAAAQCHYYRGLHGDDDRSEVSSVSSDGVEDGVDGEGRRRLSGPPSPLRIRGGVVE